VCAGQGINQLAGNAELSGRLAHTSFQDVANTKLAPDLFDIDGSPFVVPSSSIPIKRQDPATSAARIAASRRSTCSLLKVTPKLGEIECSYSTIGGPTSGYTHVPNSGLPLINGHHLTGPAGSFGASKCLSNGQASSDPTGT
jgi:hypothetical protein